MKIDVKAFADELLFHASATMPWNVSEAEFLAIVAMISDGTMLTTEERNDVEGFFALACNVAADVNPMACDAVAVYHAAREAAKRWGTVRAFSEGV
jgi:hypothetical protein